MQHSPLVSNTRTNFEWCMVSFAEICAILLSTKPNLQVTKALCANDCKSLADALLPARSAASKTSEDRRLGIELSMIKQCLSREETRFQWVKRATMPADVFITSKERGHVEPLRKLLHTARYQIRATSEMLAKRRRARKLKLLRNQEFVLTLLGCVRMRLHSRNTATSL